MEYDITPQKADIKELILQRFDHFNSLHDANVRTADKPISEPASNGQAGSVPNGKRSSPLTTASPEKRPLERETSDVAEISPLKKKRKSATVDEDAAYAARLQAEEDKRARPTRGGNTRKSMPTKKKKKVSTKSKSAKKVGTVDDSELEGSGSGLDKKEVKRTGGFHVSYERNTLFLRTIGLRVLLERVQSLSSIIGTFGWCDSGKSRERTTADSAYGK